MEEETTNYNFTKREIGEVYNSLCCLNMQIRDKIGMKRRAKFIQKLIKKVYELME